MASSTALSLSWSSSICSSQSFIGVANETLKVSQRRSILEAVAQKKAKKLRKVKSFLGNYISWVSFKTSNWVLVTLCFELRDSFDGVERKLVKLNLLVYYKKKNIVFVSPVSL